MHKPLLRRLSTAILFFFMFVTLAPTSFANYQQGESFYDQRYESSAFNGFAHTPQVNKTSSSGAFTYSYPIEIAPGRNGVQPSLALNYNSQARDNSSIVGYGWDLSLPSISRLNKKGVKEMYEESYFTSSFSGELVATNLVDDEHGTYSSKIENGDFLIYEYNSDDSWTVTDKNGTVYSLGTSADSRQDDTTDSTRIYAWMLDEMRDTNDNFVEYLYTKDLGQIYPDEINYTGNGSTAGIFSVEFDLESRTDTRTEYDSGFEVGTSYRISTITLNQSGVLRRQYSLSYELGDNGERSLLESILETSISESGTAISLPSTDFSYTSSAKTWTDLSSTYWMGGWIFAGSNGTYS